LIHTVDTDQQYSKPYAAGTFYANRPFTIVDKYCLLVLVVGKT